MRPPFVALFGVALLAAPASARAQQAPPASPPLAPPAPAPAAAPPILGSPAVQVTTLRDLRDRGVISQAQYDEAVRDVGASTGEEQAAQGVSLAFGRWATTLYGFAEGDFIYDSTQSFADLAGNAQVQRSVAPPPPAPQETYAGGNGQTQLGVRNTRFGLRLTPPGSGSVRSSGVLEMDFLGTQSLGYGPGQVGQGAFFTSPLLRIRHAMFRVETPVVDVIVGQTWHLFGWQGAYQPNTVEIQGVPGELYARTPQVRISKTMRTRPVTIEAALGAFRPPATGSVMPELEGGVRIAANGWTGMQTTGATATSIMPASLALTADYRRFEVPAVNSLVPTETVATTSTSLAADAFLPILPATKTKRDNALSLTGEVVYGAGIADLYTNLGGGVQFPAIPVNTTTNPAGLNPPPGWPQNVDDGLVDYDLTGFALHPIQWTSYLVGLQYYLPAMRGKVWLSANYSHMQSRDTTFLGSYAATSDFQNVGGVNPLKYYYPTTAGQIRAGEDWFDVNLFVDPLASVRLGAEVAEFMDHYADGFTANDWRGQVSGFFLF